MKKLILTAIVLHLGATAIADDDWFDRGMASHSRTIKCLSGTVKLASGTACIAVAAAFPTLTFAHLARTVLTLKSGPIGMRVCKTALYATGSIALAPQTYYMGRHCIASGTSDIQAALEKKS